MSNFDDIRNSLIDRKSEMDLMLSLSNSCKVREAVLIKSSIILLVYNTIEGCFSKLNREIFTFICENNIPVEVLNDELQDTYFKYHHKLIVNTINSKSLKKFYNDKKVTAVTYDDICKRMRLFSGNLDAKAIREHSKKRIGINSIPMREELNLLKVKQLRNKLAHGEITFEEAARDITLVEMQDIIKDCIRFMEKVIAKYEEFFEKKVKILI